MTATALLPVLIAVDHLLTVGAVAVVVVVVADRGHCTCADCQAGNRCCCGQHCRATEPTALGLGVGHRRRRRRLRLGGGCVVLGGGRLILGGGFAFDRSVVLDRGFVVLVHVHLLGAR
jgi:hypothetical protein